MAVNRFEGTSGLPAKFVSLVRSKLNRLSSFSGTRNTAADSVGMAGEFLESSSFE
jgi:hypothetical protein